MTAEEKRKLEAEMDFLYHKSETETGTLYDTDTLIATPDIFGNTPTSLDGDEEINYEQELDRIYQESKVLLSNMASMYLDDNPIILKHKYIKNKISNDAKNLSRIEFLQTVSERAIIKQMQQIEMGEGSPRYYEMLALIMKEMRENIKQSTMTVTTMESFYKTMKNDILSSQIASAEIQESIIENVNTKQDITTTNDINSYLEKMKKEVEEANKKNTEK